MQIRITKAVKFLLIACFAGFLIQQTGDQFFGTNILGWFALVPAGFVMQLRFWQIITYAFLHGDVTHLFLNMMMLVFIGSEIEMVWGTARFVRFYVVCAVAGGLAYLLLNLIVTGQGLYTPMVGASGAIYGLLMAYGLMFGERTLLFMMLFPMKAKHFIWILVGIELMTTVYSSRTGVVAGIAHLGGMAAGFLYLWAQTRLKLGTRFKKPWGRRGGPGAKKARKADHLKLVVNRDVGQDNDHDDDAPKTWH